MAHTTHTAHTPHARRRWPALVLTLLLALALTTQLAHMASATVRGDGETVRPPAEGGRGDAPLAPRDGRGGEPDGGDGEGSDPVEAAAQAYLRVFPELDEDRAYAAAKGQEQRKELYDALLADRAREFGGAWFDPREGVLHVAVTTRELADDLVGAGRELGVEVVPQPVEHAFVELQQVAERVRASGTALAEAAEGNVGIDVPRNVVRVEVPADMVERLATTVKDDRILVTAREDVDVEADVCNSRNDCDDSVRAGSILWRTNQGNDWCSTGITATSTATNYRYVITAGHCTNGNFVDWGTGTGTVGEMYYSADSGDLDAGAIRVLDRPYTGHPGGDIWMQGATDRRVDMDWVAPTQSYIWVGDTVCLSASFTSPSAWGNRCGVVGDNSDASVRGMTRVDGVDACGGDSGGGWYWLTSGYRIGFGVHSRSDSGCNGSAGGDTSWFTTVPRVQTWFPALEFETS